MQKILVSQTGPGDSYLLELLDYSPFQVAVYDLLMSELINMNRKTDYEQAKGYYKDSNDWWLKHSLDSFDLRNLTHTIYPKDSVPNFIWARKRLKERFLVECQKLRDYVMEENGVDQPFILDDFTQVSSRYVSLSFSRPAVHRAACKAIPSPVEVPVVLYRPQNKVRSALSFVVNRRLMVHLKMNAKHMKGNTIRIPLYAAKAFLSIQDQAAWEASKEPRNHQSGLGSSRWLERAIRQPIEAYGLFRFDGLVRVGRDQEQTLLITRLF